MAAPLNIDQTVGGSYMITRCSPLWFEEDWGGLDEGGDSDEYGSESDGIVSWELVRSGGDGGCSLSAREVIVVMIGVVMQEEDGFGELSCDMEGIHPQLFQDSDGSMGDGAWGSLLLEGH